MRREPAHYKTPSLEQQLKQEQRKKYYAKRANQRRLGQTWVVAFAEIAWPSVCPIFGIELDYFSEGRAENSVSITKRNRSKPWDCDNTYVCSYRAVQVKGIGTLEEHEKVCMFMRKELTVE